MGKGHNDNTSVVDQCGEMGQGTLDTILMQTIRIVVIGKCLLVNMQAQGKLQEQQKAY